MAFDVLLVEDEEEIAQPLLHTLGREGYEVRWAQTGADALTVLAAPGTDPDSSPDLVILDLGLPDMDGLEVCKQARAGGFPGAILILTARANEVDLVVGLDHGADDYLAKPFGLAELQARVRALLRRARSGLATASTVPGAASGPSEQRADVMRVDVEARRVFVGASEVGLTGKEFDVLALLSAHEGKVVSRETLMARVWDENWFGSTKTLDVTIGRLRSKLDPVGQAQRIVAVRGVGFRLESP